MVIQHNIMAINSHRQLGINNTNLGKNLEKLSSGYRINRAADDAAGLAISEKMRAQITGLDRAILNAQDGASLIQTAEGALQEVHGMLNRMVELATQSANGTYQADDRQKIEAEVEALKEEIDRISKATNFNGIQLLDGSLSSTAPKDIVVGGVRVNETAATPGKYEFTMTAVTGLNIGDKVSYTYGTNQDESITIEFTVTEDGKNLRAADGTVYKLDDGKTAEATGGKGELGANAVAKAIATELNKTSAYKDFIITNNAAKLVVNNRVAGSDATQVRGLSVTINDTAIYTNMAVATPGAPTDAKREIMMDDLVVFAKDGDTWNEDIATFTVNGEKFVLVDAAALADKAASNKYAAAVAELQNRGVNIISIKGDAVAASDLAHIAADINHKTGLAIRVNGTDTGLELRSKNIGNGLTMQVGDTADDFNKITVSVDDLSSKGLGIQNISMATQESAANALTKIKSAIEKVSVNRGNLGALQNRLSYTINNLGVTSENMTAAESRIRDTDMAKEMMAFTKNNVLAQAAQAMLAQANQQPQQVLQLLR